MKTYKFVEIDGEFYAPNHAKAIAACQRMAGLPNPEREPRAVPPLVDSPKKHRARKRSVAICVTITSYRTRQIDSDNLASGAKPTRDAIARSLGIDDGDPRITWEYRSIVTTGAVGTHVLITAKD